MRHNRNTDRNTIWKITLFTVRKFILQGYLERQRGNEEKGSAPGELKQQTPQHAQRTGKTSLSIEITIIVLVCVALENPLLS